MRAILGGLLALLLWVPAAVAAPTPIINFGTAAPSILSTVAKSTPLSTIVMTMSNGSTFTGTLSLTATANNLCVISARNLNTGKIPPLTVGSFKCTIKATQSGVSVSKSITIQVTNPTLGDPIVNFSPSSGSVTTTTPVVPPTPIAQMVITMSDGSAFNGTLSFGGAYGNGNGACGLSSATVPSNLTLIADQPVGTFHCSVVATQGSRMPSGDIAVTVSAPAPTVTFNPTSAAIQDTTSAGTFLSAVSTTMPDGSTFAGTLGFGGMYGNGGGACALAPPGITLVAPTTNTLVDSEGTWSFSPTFFSPYGYPILLNGVDSIGQAMLLLSYNGHTYVQNAQGVWYVWGGSLYQNYPNDPRPPGSRNLNLGTTLAANTYNCSVVATPTQGAASAPSNFQIIVSSAATPTVVFNPASASPFDNTAIGTPLSVVSVTMSNGSTFTGQLSFFGTGGSSGHYGNGGGVCALSKTTAPANLTLGKPLPAGPSTQHCTVAATQGSNTSTTDIAIAVIGPTPTVAYGTNPVSVPSTTPVGQPLSTILVTMSDGSPFNGNLAFTAPYNNGSGVCQLTPAGTTLVAPTVATLVDSEGTWGFASNYVAPYGYPILRNGVDSIGASVLLLSYNGHTYAQSAQPAWYVWNGSAFVSYPSDPRPPGAAGSIGFGGGAAGSYHCTVTATEGLASALASLPVTVTGGATPTTTLAPSSKSIPDTTAVNTPLSTVSVAMSDGSAFSGSLALAGQYGNGGGACVLSNATLPATINLGKAVTVAGSPYNCTVVATQGVATSPANFALTVTGLTLSMTYANPTPSIPPTSQPGTPLSNITVTVSDGSAFKGTLSFGGGGTFGNDGGICALLGGGGAGITIPPANSILDSTGVTWTLVGGQAVRNGVIDQVTSGIILLLYYNSVISQETSELDSNGHNLWFSYISGTWTQIAGDPRPPGSGLSLVTGPAALPPNSTQHCTVVATQ